MVKVVYIQDYGCDKVGKVKTLTPTIAKHVISLGICEAITETTEIINEVKQFKKHKKNEKVN